MTRLLIALPSMVFVVVAFATPETALQIHGDVELYHRVSLAVLQGALPYRDVPLEYPPASLVPMLVPRLLVPDAALGVVPYRLVFAAWNGLLASVVAVLLVAIARSVRTGADAQQIVGGYVLLVVLGAGVLPWRFDLFPIALTAAAVLLVLRQRPLAAGLTLGLATGAKLYPAVLLPVLVLWLLASGDRRAAIRLTVATGATVALVFAPFLLADADSALLPFRYQAGRGLEIESLAASIVEILGIAGLTTVKAVNQASAIHLDSTLAPLFLGATLVLTATAFLLVLATTRDVFRATAAAAPGEDASRGLALIEAVVLTLTVLLLTSKIFSAQFCWWLLPFAALVRPSRFVLAAIAAAMTLAVYPTTFLALTDQQPLAVALLATRNLTLLALAVTVWSDLRSRLDRPTPTIRLSLAANGLAILVVGLLVARAIALTPAAPRPSPCQPSSTQQGRPAPSSSKLPVEPGDCRPT